jgi:hypothetical protein
MSLYSNSDQLKPFNFNPLELTPKEGFQSLTID